MGFRGIAERDIYDVLADVKRRFPVDEDRIYLTGISAGGGGALWLGLTRPDLWAAIAPVCAEAPPGTAELAGNALDTPIELYHGERDPIVPAPRGTRSVSASTRVICCIGMPSTSLASIAKAVW